MWQPNKVGEQCVVVWLSCCLSEAVSTVQPGCHDARPPPLNVLQLWPHCEGDLSGTIVGKPCAPSDVVVLENITNSAGEGKWVRCEQRVCRRYLEPTTPQWGLPTHTGGRSSLPSQVALTFCSFEVFTRMLGSRGSGHATRSVRGCVSVLNQQLAATGRRMGPWDRMDAIKQRHSGSLEPHSCVGLCLPAVLKRPAEGMGYGQGMGRGQAPKGRVQGQGMARCARLMLFWATFCAVLLGAYL